MSDLFRFASYIRTRTRALRLVVTLLAGYGACCVGALADDTCNIGFHYPVPGSVVSGYSTLTGWAVCVNTAVSNVSVNAGSTWLGNVAPWDPDPYICSLFPTWVGCNSGSDHVGFHADINSQFSRRDPTKPLP